MSDNEKVAMAQVTWARGFGPLPCPHCAMDHYRRPQDSCPRCGTSHYEATPTGEAYEVRCLRCDHAWSEPQDDPGPQIWGCCDDPACGWCNGSGIVHSEEGDAFVAALEKVMK